MDDIEVERIIKKHGLPKFTNSSIVDEKTYKEEIVNTRRLGYALDKGEYLSGVNAIAVGLGHHRGLPLALWVVGFAESFQAERIDMVLESTLVTADALRKVLNTD
jgi:DNA-binding IclR family transcriptional regulator